MKLFVRVSLGAPSANNQQLTNATVLSHFNSYYLQNIYCQQLHLIPDMKQCFAYRTCQEVMASEIYHSYAQTDFTEW